MLNKVWGIDCYRNDLKLDFTISENCDYTIEVIKLFIFYQMSTSFRTDSNFTRTIGVEKNIEDFFDEDKLDYLGNVYINTQKDYNQFVSYFIYMVYFYAKKNRNHWTIEDYFKFEKLNSIHQSNAIEFIENFYSNINNNPKLLEKKYNYENFIKDSLIITGTHPKNKFIPKYLEMFNYVHMEKLIPIYELVLFDYDISSSVAIDSYKNFVLQYTQGFTPIRGEKYLRTIINNNFLDTPFYERVLGEIDKNLESQYLIAESDEVLTNFFLENIVDLLEILIKYSKNLNEELKERYKLKKLEVIGYRRHSISKMKNYDWKTSPIEIPQEYITQIENYIVADFKSSFLDTFLISYPLEIKKIINQQGEFPFFAMANKQEYDIDNYQTTRLSTLIEIEPQNEIDVYLNQQCKEYLKNPDQELVNGSVLEPINLAALVNYYIRRHLTIPLGLFYKAFKNIYPNDQIVDYIEEIFKIESIFKDKLINRTTYGIVISNIIKSENILLKIYNKICDKNEGFFSPAYLEKIFLMHSDECGEINNFENTVLNIYFILYSNSGLKIRNNYCHGNKVFNKEIEYDLIDIIYSYIALMACYNLSCQYGGIDND